LIDQGEVKLRQLLRKVKPWGWNAELTVKDWHKFLENFDLTAVEAEQLRPISEEYLSKAKESRAKGRENQALSNLEEALRVSPFDWIILRRAVDFLWEGNPASTFDPVFLKKIYTRYYQLSPNQGKAKQMLRRHGFSLPNPWAKIWKGLWNNSRRGLLFAGLAILVGGGIGLAIALLFPLPSPPPPPGPLPREERPLEYYSFDTQAPYQGGMTLGVYPETDVIRFDGQIVLPEGSWQSVQFTATTLDEKGNLRNTESWNLASDFEDYFPGGVHPIDFPWVLDTENRAINNIRYKVDLDGQNEEPLPRRDTEVRWSITQPQGSALSFDDALITQERGLGDIRLRGFLRFENRGAMTIKNIAGHYGLEDQGQVLSTTPFQREFPAPLRPDEGSFLEIANKFSNDPETLGPGVKSFVQITSLEGP
jgi:hypothetical protein